MNRFHQSLLVTAVLLAGAGGASVSFAQADNILFIDGGYAEMCASLATSVGEVDQVALTGSRLGVSSMEICTKAIESGETTLDQRAASFNNRGVLWFGEGNYEAALQDFDAAVAINDELAQAFINRGYTFIAMKRWPESIQAFDKAMSLGEIPEADKVHYNRGIAKEETGDVRGAYFDYKTASELNPVWEAPKAELSRFTVKKK